MPINRKLLEILVCPITKQPVSMLPEIKLKALNQKIEAGKVTNHGGEKITEPLGEALITRTGTVIYPIDHNIPVMLENQSIDTVQLGDW